MRAQVAVLLGMWMLIAAAFTTGRLVGALALAVCGVAVAAVGAIGAWHGRA